MNKGKIVQVLGPVVDVEFEEGVELPCIKDALEVDNDGKRCVMEVSQHLGNNTVRCIMLASSAVSYTHLDVYKRQPPYCDQLRRLAGPDYLQSPYPRLRWYHPEVH